MNPPGRDLFQSIGDTPLVRLDKLSAALGRTIVGKAEFLNPGGSVKDRAAKYILLDAERSGRIGPKNNGQPGVIVEGTAGNTGIALTLLGNARGYRSIIVMPETQSREKIDLLRVLGADVRLVPAVPFSDEGNYYHVAQRLAATTPGALFADQFENTANRDGHYQSTGPEIWSQTGGRLDAFTCAAGTGGTYAGCAQALKERSGGRVRVVLADAMGSSLYHQVKDGTLNWDGESSIEGIGIRRVTANFAGAPVDDAMQVDDRAAVAMCHYLLHEEGLLLGGSAGLNVTAAARLALTLPEGSVVATILCDGGGRYLSRLYDSAWLQSKGLLPLPTGLSFL